MATTPSRFGIIGESRTGESQHVIQAGDTVDSIARQYGVSSEALLKLNPHIRDLEGLRPGMSLLIPIVPQETGPQTVQDTIEEAQKPNPFTTDLWEVDNSLDPSRKGKPKK